MQIIPVKEVRHIQNIESTMHMKCLASLVNFQNVTQLIFFMFFDILLLVDGIADY